MNIQKILDALTLEEKASLCSGSDFWHTQAVERLGIPALMMCDGPHGLRKQCGDADHLGINKSIETVCYPTASALASSFDREVLGKLGDLLGQECQAEDVAMLLGPGLNIKRSPLCGRNFEYFSEDPYLAGALAAEYIRHLQAQGVSACPKHFAANNQETKRMSISSEIGERALHEIYLPAFEAAVKQGKTNSIMCAYNAINGVFCAENKALLTDILRKKWGFNGFVVTDWGAVKDRVLGLKAGLDLEMPGGNTQDSEIVKAVRNGTLEEAVLDEAVKNVLNFVSGALENRNKGAAIDREQCSAHSAEVSAQCAVLLKNSGALPLRRETSVAFIGEFAQTPRYQGSGSSHINVPHPVSALEAAGNLPICYARGYDVRTEHTEPELLEQAVNAAREASAAVIFAGLPDSYESEGFDRETLALPGNQNALISAVAAVQPNTVVVLHGGSVMELPWAQEVNAILCMHLGGSGVGTATVRLLYGDENPSGKLAESWPLRLEDNPSYLSFPGEDKTVAYFEDIFVGYRYYDKKKLDVRYPFGHGLSYTQFAYSDIKLDKAAMQDTDTLRASCTVENTGAVSGKEVVQLYVRDVQSSVRRPVRELRGFQKVHLQPGERKTLEFTLSMRDFAYYEPQIQDWYVESGEFVIELGASSRDIRLCASVNVTGTKEIPVVYTRFSPVRDLLKTAKGRELVTRLMPQPGNSAGDAEALGEGSDKMMEEMAMSMPLMALSSFGHVPLEQLDAMIGMLNSKP